jgi:COP9 signalosome complex subunit 1
LNQAFAPEGESIENELVSMIRDGTLRARLDSKNKVTSTHVYDTMTDY